VAAIDTHATPTAPQGPDDGDRLLERLDRLTRVAPRPAHCPDRIPQGAGAQAELEAAAADDVQGSRCLRQHRRVAQRQVRDVGEDPHPRGLGSQGRHEHPGIEVPSLVGVILDADEVEAELVAEPDLVDDLGVVVRVGDWEEAELHRPAVVHHASLIWRVRAADSSSAARKASRARR
jgi:hypothetical protein